MATAVIDTLDDWLRGPFVELNTTLDEASFAAGVDALDDPRALRLAEEGVPLVAACAGALPADAPWEERYTLLGMAGFVLAACARHGIGGDALAPAEAVAARLGAGLGVAPRAVFAHMAFFNAARGGAMRTFTAIPDDARFTELNALAVLGYDRAWAALSRVPGVGVSSPVAGVLLDQARVALEDVLAANQRVAREVSIDRFFLNIRPYFKSHPVTGTMQRGINAGDFAAVNGIDVVLGLVAPDDPAYAPLLAEKRPFVPPPDRAVLDGLGAVPSLLAAFEAEPAGDALRANAARYLAVCRAHGAAYAFHHTALVKPFLERPAARLPVAPETVSASGPPLDVVLGTLDGLRAMRMSRGPRERLAARGLVL